MMNQEPNMWKTAIIALAALALLVIGVGIIVYVGVARDRLSPTPTLTPTVTRSPESSQVATPAPTPQAEPAASVLGVVREYSPGALIIVLTPLEGAAEQVIVPENLEVTWADGRRASPMDIGPGQKIFAEGVLDALGRLVATRIVITEQGKQPTVLATVTRPIAVSSATPSPKPSATTAPTESGRAWKGEYFANKTLSGSPALVRNDATLDFRWQAGAPANGLPSDGFSARWRGRWFFDAGGYRFYAYVDDGVRLWVDGALIIDSWTDKAATLVYGDASLRSGEHDVQVEYYEGTDKAQIRIWWDFQGTYPDWKGAYYTNPYLSGEPTLIRNDQQVNFDWGAGSPAPQLAADDWSARWPRTITFEEGAYRFYVQADDGVRLWVDSPLLIDEWHQSKPTTYEGYIWLDRGPHEVRVEFFELKGDARIHFGWEKLENYAHWKSEYYANPDLSGRPAFIRDDVNIDFNWGKNSPAASLPVDNFSIRWTRKINLASGSWRFWAEADDGVRLYVDKTRIINDWRDGGAGSVEGLITLESGDHTIVIEYYERGDLASIRVGWELVSTATPTPSSTATPIPHTPTATPEPATATPTTMPATATPTESPTPPTATPTFTPAGPTLTPTSEATPITPDASISPTATTQAEVTAGILAAIWL